MKKFSSIVLIVALGILMMNYISSRSASAAIDFDVFKGAAIADGQIDGTIGTEWDDAGHYTSVLIDPAGTAEIWTKHDGTNLYIALKFTADSNNPWVTFQLGADTCMDNSADLALFGDDNVNSNGYRDSFYDSGSSASADSTQNGAGAINIGVGNLVTVELKKPLNSGDTAGKDIAWLEGNQYTLVIAWDSNGNGSSGGTTNHKIGSTPTSRNILVDPAAIPEFPGWMFIVVLLIAMVPVIILARKILPKLPNTRKL